VFEWIGYVKLILGAGQKIYRLLHPRSFFLFFEFCLCSLQDGVHES
jgi:hypothetical protein